ncbi:MAG: hypothetical protein ACIAXF_05955 [Phycisphaerales bacterium JB063]
MRLPLTALLVLCVLPVLGCNTADKHYWNWRNGFDRDFSFSYLSVDPARSGDPEQIDPNDFEGPGLSAYRAVQQPNVFYRSLAITEGTRVTLAIFPPDSEQAIVIGHGVSGGNAGVFSTKYSATTAIQMFWVETIDWVGMAQRYGYGTYAVCWYWDDNRKAAARHTFELTP